MPTLRDVAKLACCDVSTVSRALNNNPCVHAETKKRIMAAVEKLSYRPNLLAKGLRQGKRHSVGIVVPHLHLSVFSMIAQSIEATLREAGYSAFLCSVEDNPIAERDSLNRLRNGLVDGIIIAGTGKNKNLIRDIHRVKPADFKQFVFLPADLLVGILEKDAVLIEFPYIKIGIGKIFHFDCFMTGRVFRRNRKKKVLPL